MELAIAQKRNEVLDTIQHTVSEYYNIDLNKNTEDSIKKKQNIAMFVSKLTTTKDKNGDTAIMKASPESIRECALAYVNGDFDFFRNQAYLISYGNTIQFIVSKDGLACAAKKIVPGLELFSDIVYKNDTFEYEKVGGRTIIKKHVQPIENVTCKIDDIVCAYATAWKDGVQVEANIMTMKEITNALATAHRSLTDFHKNNPKIMLGKFPLRQLCKKIINQNVSMEVRQVLGDEDTIEVEPTTIETKPESVAINFEEKEVKPKRTTKKAAETKIEEEPKQETIFDSDISETIKDGVSIFDMMDKKEQAEPVIRTVKYAEWKNKLQLEMTDWRAIDHSYDEITKTIKIEKIG